MSISGIAAYQPFDGLMELKVVKFYTSIHFKQRKVKILLFGIVGTDAILASVANECETFERSLLTDDWYQHLISLSFFIVNLSHFIYYFFSLHF